MDRIHTQEQFCESEKNFHRDVSHGMKRIWARREEKNHFHQRKEYQKKRNNF